MPLCSCALARRTHHWYRVAMVMALVLGTALFTASTQLSLHTPSISACSTSGGWGLLGCGVGVMRCGVGGEVGRERVWVERGGEAGGGGEGIHQPRSPLILFSSSGGGGCRRAAGHGGGERGGRHREMPALVLLLLLLLLLHVVLLPVHGQRDSGGHAAARSEGEDANPTKNGRCGATGCGAARDEAAGHEGRGRLLRGGHHERRRRSEIHERDRTSGLDDGSAMPRGEARWYGGGGGGGAPYPAGRSSGLSANCGTPCCSAPRGPLQGGP